MNWKRVTDKQIAEVGFGDGEFGPETLGLKFKPGKPYGPIAEYHYQNVTPRMYRALEEADQPHKYFNEHIKSDSDAFPFVKV